MLGIAIDLARGLAALGVFLFHIADRVSPYSEIAGVIARNGDLGVPLFFVISGYCIASSAQGFHRRGDRPIQFLEKRFLRIFPPFWASIVVVLMVPYVLELASFAGTGHLQWPERDWQKYDLRDWVEVVTLTRIFTGNPGEPLHVPFNGINPVYWSLAIEFQFYLVMFAALYCGRRFHAVVAAVTIISVLLAIVLPVPYYYGFFITYWPLFALGVILFYSLKHRYSLVSLPRIPALFLTSTFLGTITLFVVKAALDDRLKHLNLLGFGGGWMSFAFLSALALWSIAPLDADLKKAAANSQWLLAFPIRVGAFLGVISYSLYLLHPKVYQVWDKFSKLLSLQQGPVYPLLLVVGTIGLSYLFYLACEKPFIHGGKLYKKIARTG